MPESLIESELFGHEKGAFTGAVERRAGCLDLAQHGTLLLDEIGDMPLNTQAKLLRVLEDSRVRRLGGWAETVVDVRVLASTNKNLAEAIRQNQFREDLFYRLNVFEIHLPPLRERLEDVPLLARTLLEATAAELPAYRLGELRTAEEKERLRRETDGLIRQCAAALSAAEGRVLTAVQAEMVNRVRTFAQQARETMETDPGEARNFAAKGRTFAEALLAELK